MISDVLRPYLVLLWSVVLSPEPYSFTLLCSFDPELNSKTFLVTTGRTRRNVTTSVTKCTTGTWGSTGRLRRHSNDDLNLHVRQSLSFWTKTDDKGRERPKHWDPYSVRKEIWNYRSEYFTSNLVHLSLERNPRPRFSFPVY